MTLSASNIQRIRALQQKKFRKEYGLFVVEGIKTVQELVNSSIEVVDIYSTEKFDFPEKIAPELLRIIKEKELNRISGLKTPNKILAIAAIPESQVIDWNSPIILMLDGIRDPGNLGTIIRTAKWFGVDTVICSTDCADVYNQKVVQSTMGALFHVNVRYETLPDTIAKCKKNNYKLIGAAMQGQSVYSFDKSTKTVLVVGSESHGISDEVIEKCDELITIPNNEQEQRVESLNASIATSIFLSELTRPKMP